jgi:plastocyanin
MRRSSMVCLAAILGLTLIAASCSDDGTSSPAEGGTPSEEEATDVSGMTELDMEVDSFYFEPAILQGSGGQTLTIHLGNESDADHTFTIDDQSIDVELAGGDSTDVDVSFPDSGSVTFYCRFHESSGMVGELTVA